MREPGGGAAKSAGGGVRRAVASVGRADPTSRARTLPESQAFYVYSSMALTMVERRRQLVDGCAGVALPRLAAKPGASHLLGHSGVETRG